MSRFEQARDWALKELNRPDAQVGLASEDASFRSYYRIVDGQESWIIMDAPPEHETCEPYIKIADKMRADGVNTPEIIAQDLDNGFLLISDFGDTHYLKCFEGPDRNALYERALNTLDAIQSIEADDVPEYDESLLRQEMDLFQEWLLEKYLGLTVSKEQEQLLETAKKLLVDNALEQPQVFVHRDYHSRNLMVLPDGETGVLDFQDAVKGPLTYDLVSLLRDCYARLPIFDRRQMMEYFRQKVLKRIDRPMMKAQFSLWFDRMGVQRHLKAAGIFARLSVRDGKHQFLEDISTTLVYIIEATADERALSPLGDFIAEEVLPALEEKRLG